eukprot:NODE_337_length_10662_cov_0.497207.p8 type:complete len:104 gc:universal NODE_337_length_10662_cov_0.497207:2835-2524(-)
MSVIESCRNSPISNSTSSIFISCMLLLINRYASFANSTCISFWPCNLASASLNLIIDSMLLTVILSPIPGSAFCSILNFLNLLVKYSAASADSTGLIVLQNRM